MLEFLKESAQDGPIRGVMHSFTGSIDVAQGCLEMGLYISFAGMVTYKNAEDIREVAKHIPTDRLLVETDCPYLAPHPHRGKRPNKPAWIVHTLLTVAETRGLDASMLAAQTTKNAQALFGKWNDV
jgi:TatD DNase family protein